MSFRGLSPNAGWPETPVFCFGDCCFCCLQINTSYTTTTSHTLSDSQHISQNAGWSFLRRACAPVHARCPCSADLQTRIRELHHHHHQLARALNGCAHTTSKSSNTY